MATTQVQRAKARRAAERDPQVYHPLDQLRGIIRRYIMIEVALSAILFVALWFSVGLALDYGLFKISGWDWARDTSRWLRGIVLFLVVVAFVAFLALRLIGRLTKEFSYRSLALVLERKFPKLLGDRLITAVEMADVEAMGKFGYSKDMILATIAEARERVAKVQVNKVFNWRRLWVLGFFAVGLMLGTVVFAFASHAIATKSVSPIRAGWKFAHVTGIFLERNVALMNTPWPRRAHIEFVDFPANDELAVGRDAPPPRVTARAYRWVIADSNTPDGWRPMRWSDVNEDLVGRSVPALPKSFRVTGSASAGDGSPSIDALERVAYESEDNMQPEAVKGREFLKFAMNNIDADGKIRSTPTHDYEEMQEVFKALIAKADQPSMGRTLRRLDVPDEVTYKFSGRKTAGSGALVGQANNEFAGEITGLKEDVVFVVRAADYTSAPKKIRLIPPPTLQRLIRDHSEPAYLHHEPPQGEGYSVLKGKLQKIAPKDLSLTGDRTVFVVPAGSELTITAEAFVNDDKKLDDNDRIVSAVAIPVAGRFPGTVLDDKGKPTQTPVALPLVGDGEGFRVSFKNGPKDHKDPEKNTDFRVMEDIEFKVTWVNKFNVSATRTIRIQASQDQAPAVEFAVDVIRKQGNVYLVTPAAQIPFNPDSFVKDDHGLSKVEYVFNYWAEDSDVVRAFRTQSAMRVMFGPHPAGSGGAGFLPVVWADGFRAVDKTDDRRNGSVFVSEFINQQRRLPLNSRDVFERLLQTPKSDDTAAQTVKKVELKDPSRDFFDLRELHRLGVLKIAVPPGELQPIYRMDLNIQATDNNVDGDGGQKVTRNTEPIRLKIIQESDLLHEIGKEEKQLAERLNEALAKIAAARKKYQFVKSKNGYENETPDQVDPIKVRGQDALQDIEKSRDILQSVSRELHRLHRECVLNRVEERSQKVYAGYAAFADLILSELNPTGSKDIPITFPTVLARVNNVQSPLNTGRWAPLAAVTDAESAMYQLEEGVKFIRKLFGDEDSIEKIREKLEAVQRAQERVRAEIIKMRAEIDAIATLPYPSIQVAGVQSFGKSETKVITHVIRWNQFEGDDFTVKVTASDPSITVPTELKLNFEKNQFKFDYAVKSGTKEGTFKIILTPPKGQGPVIETQIIVGGGK